MIWIDEVVSEERCRKGVNMAKKISDKMRKHLISRLECIPDIPDKKEFWGREYTSKCPCGGTLTAIRST